MAKLLRSRDRILLGLAVLGDALDRILRSRSRTIRALRLGWFAPPDYSDKALQTAVSRLLTTGLIKRIVKNGEAVWELSGAGEKQLHRSFPLIQWQKKKWDGWWRIVIFDIAEVKSWVRQRLRRKLKELGFGQWQKSVYVSPHDVAEDIKEFLKANHLAGQASVLVCRELWPENPDKIERLWHLDKLNRQYRAVVDYWEKIKDKKRGIRDEARRLIADYLEIIEADPFLPKEFLPKPWFGDQARQVFKNLLFLNRSDQIV